MSSGRVVGLSEGQMLHVPLPTGCFGTAGTRMRMHSLSPSHRGTCPKWLTPVGTVATMRTIQMRRLRTREGQQPIKVKSSSSGSCL